MSPRATLGERLIKAAREARRIARGEADPATCRGHPPENGYRAMAQDEARERDALDWSEALLEDATDDGS